MASGEALTLEQLLEGACAACRAHALVVHAIEADPPIVTLRCTECGHLQHAVHYKPVKNV
ncbi:MAG: hypothetical protein QM736_16285 [Vicinamibacterales bacterium]